MNATKAAGSWFASSWTDAGHLDGAVAMPAHFRFPLYHVPQVSITPLMSDKYLSLLSPIIAYWVVSAWFYFLDTMQFPFFERYRLHEPQEISKRNRVSAARVATMVVLQQILQTILGIFVLEGDEVSLTQVFADHEGRVNSIAQYTTKFAIATLGVSNGMTVLRALGPWFANWVYWWGIPAVQTFWFFIVLDAWEYALHRAFHESRWLYNNFHSHHHRLYVPYAFGALYNHPIEGLLLDSAGASVAHLAALMSIRQGIAMFVFSTIKTVCDHGGYAFPAWLDPLHLVFPNTAEYHDVHHQMQGLRYNYSQPFFVHFDVLFGTRMSAEKFAKMRAVNKRFKQTADATEKEHTSLSQTNINGTTAATSIEEKATRDSLRRRTNGQPDDSNDLSPEEIALGEGANGDPTVTLSGESYRAKAGVAT